MNKPGLRLRQAWFVMLKLAGVSLLWVGVGGACLCLFGLIALQFYIWLREGDAPSYSWNAIMGPVSMRGWAGLDEIFMFLGGIHIGVILAIPGCIIGFFGAYIEEITTSELDDIQQALTDPEVTTLDEMRAKRLRRERGYGDS